MILLGLIIPIQVKAETSNINLNSLEVISEVSPLGDDDYDIYGYTVTLRGSDSWPNSIPNYIRRYCSFKGLRFGY